MPKIEIFRVGTHTAMQGVTLEFSEDKLAAACAAYDPTLHEAPLVVGHPTATAPAFGWVKGMGMDGTSVVADCDQVNPDFAELVKTGAFKKVSASWYGPTNPANPKPGTYYLRHVGFLGAQPPAIKGLRAVDFAEDDGEVVTVEFGEATDRRLVTLFRTLRDFLLAEFGQEKADQALPGWTVDWLSEDVAREAAQAEIAATPAFSEPQQTKEPPVGPNTQPTPAELEAKAAKLAQDQADFAERQTKFRRDQNGAWLDGLVAEGRPLPMPKDDLLSFMEAISADGMVVDFAEGDGKTAKKAAVDVFKTLLKGMPVTVDFSERAPGTPGDEATTDPTDLARRALDFQETQAKVGIVISTTDAVAHVQKEAAK
ncbi:hypothetical protein [Magnetospirillum fulvum]|uniref:Peptidase n=1 Tax=Magnetospirillum fulvum MGU-K5 TaxID=1316936 RepID=S9TQM6_MAGFU|nr:hypothetical protein [Magnetospirillum fulvum]EPY00875.1 hypothetical protein K678_13945 [Magnetospirillum fulvum MGU-K5]